MIHSLIISDEQARLLSSRINDSMAVNGSLTEFYINVEHARDIEYLDCYINIVPEIEKGILKGAKVVQLIN